MTNVGVYKTDVTDRSEAKTITDSIHRQFPETDVLLDLEDRNKVHSVNNYDSIHDLMYSEVP